MADFSATLLVMLAVRRGNGRKAQLRTMFILLALSIFLWQATVLVEVRVDHPVDVQLWVGRFNFAVVVIAVYLVVRFVELIPTIAAPPWRRRRAWLAVETGLLFAVTLMTPLIDNSEQLVSGERAITSFGPLFPLYLLHVLTYLSAAVAYAFSSRETEHLQTRRQLSVIGFGLLASASIGFVTNAALPYAFAEYRFCNFGPVSATVFTIAVGYSTFRHRLFGRRVIIKRAAVFGLMIVIVVATFRSAVYLAGEYLAARTGKVTEFAALVIAFSVEPLRRVLEKRVVQLLRLGYKRSPVNVRRRLRSTPAELDAPARTEE